MDIYGLPGLTLHDKETVRISSLLALRGSTLAKVCNTLGVPLIAETPELRDGQPSVIRLPEWWEIYMAPATRRRNIVQCELGAGARKTSELWGTVCLDGLPEVCTHPSHPGLRRGPDFHIGAHILG